MELLLIGGGLLAIAYALKKSEKETLRSGAHAGASAPLAKLRANGYQQIMAESPPFLNDQKLVNLLKEDPISLQPIAKPVFLSPNLQNGKVPILYDYDSISQLLTTKNPKSPFTRRPIARNSVVRYG